VDTKSQGINLSTHASKNSIGEFLPIVKDIYQIVLSMDVLAHMGAKNQQMDTISNKVKFLLIEKIQMQALPARAIMAPPIGSLHLVQKNLPTASCPRPVTEGLAHKKQFFHQQCTKAYYGCQAKKSLSSLNNGDSYSQPKVWEGLNLRGSDYLKGVENRFVRRIGNQLGIPRYTPWDQLRPVVQEMADEFLHSRNSSDAAIAKAFDTAYDNGTVAKRDSLHYGVNAVEPALSRCPPDTCI